MVEATWGLFLVASLAVILTPGQDTMLVLTRSIAQGQGAGVLTAAGVSAGLIGHTLLATLGLGALLRASETLFLGLKFAGAAYMICLGIVDLRTPRSTLDIASVAPRPMRRLFVDGALSNLLNPYVVVFYFAFLPQFVAADASHPTLTIMVLGLTYAALAFCEKAPIALGAGWLSKWLRARPGVLPWVCRGSGVILVLLGARLLLAPA